MAPKKQKKSTSKKQPVDNKKAKAPVTTKKKGK